MPPKYRIAAVLALAGVLPWLVSQLAAALFGAAPRINEPLHQFMELTGTGIALGVAMLLLLRARHDRIAPHLLWVVTALVAMGLVDGAHGLIPFGASWSWLRHGATFLGGSLFALVWVPVPTAVRGRVSSFVLAVGVVVLALAVGVWWRPELLPAPWSDGGYTLPVRAANALGGLGFLAAALFFMRRYLRRPETEDLVFASHTLLFGSASLWFGFSQVWDPEWWVWHAARLLAYAVVLVTAFNIIGALYQVIEQHAHELEARVLERTKALNASEVEARRQKDLLAVTLASIGDAVIVTDRQGRVTFMNPEAERLTGWRADEAEDRPLTEVFRIVNEHTGATVESPVSKVMCAGSVVGLANHTILIARDGTKTAIDDSGAPVRSADGVVLGVVLVFRDISERRRAEAEIQSLARFPEENPNPVLRAAGDGAVLYVNAPAQAMLAASGWHEGALLPEPLHEAVGRVLGGAQNQEVEFASPAGRVWSVIVSANPGERYVNLYGRDITARKAAEQALRASEQGVRRKLETVLAPEGDVGALELHDLIDCQVVQSLMNDFYKVTRLPMSILDTQARVLVGVGWQDICTRFHRVQSTAARHCLESDTQLAAGLSPGEFRLYRCKNNMWDMATPIVVAGRLVGHVFSGQFFFDDETPDRERFRVQARDYGFDEEDYLAALDRVPRLSRELVERGMSFFMKLAAMLSQLGRSNLKLARLLAERDRLLDSLKQSEQHMARAQEIAHLGSWELDLAADHLTWSDEVYRIFGLSPQRFAATYEAFLERVHPADRALVDEVYTGSIRAGRDAYEIDHRVVRYGTGETRWVHEKCQHVRDAAGHIIRSMGMVLDITERKQMEEELRTARVSAERAKAVAEDASRAKDHFLAVLSHELRTPLTPVLATVALLERDPGLSADQRDGLEMIRRNTELEARLIEDLLDLTRIARGKIVLDRRPLELCTVIRRAIEVCQPDLAQRRLHCGIDATPCGTNVVHGDAARLQQVFWNLLKNAIKFTPADGCISIRCRREPGQAVVEVQDSGIGIEPEGLQRIFNAFEQAERTTARRFGGLGLGLAISRALIEMHGGTISAQSPGRNQGATFTVRLPLCRVPEPAAAPAAPGTRAESAGRHLRILLVEDHGDTADVLKRLLRGNGHEVQTAGDAQTALELAAQGEFDLLISDLGLPDASGLELMRELRARGCTIPGIALTGYGQEEDVRRSHRVGFARHLTKPVHFEQLADAISELAQEAP